MEGGLFRLGRPVPPDTQRLILLFVGLLYIFAGGSGCALALFAPELVLHKPGALVIGGVSVATGIALIGLHVTHPQVINRRFAALSYALQFGSPVFVVVAQYMLGPRTILPFLLLTQVTIFSFYLMTVVVASTVIALIGVELAVLFAIQPGYASPIAQWAFVMGTVIAAGATFGGLMARALEEVDRFNRLRRFLPDQVASRLLDSGSEEHLRPHRREIAVIFVDLRNFTRFASDAAPEEVVDLLGEYYRAVAQPLQAANATVGALMGDGLMAYFNDPVPCNDPAGTAVRVALAVRRDLQRLIADWDDKGFHLGVGMGIAFGYATLGTIGLESRGDYTALGPVVNLASRLCAEAANGEILIDQRTYASTRKSVDAAVARQLHLKGFAEIVTARVVTTLDGPATATTPSASAPA